MDDTRYKIFNRNPSPLTRSGTGRWLECCQGPCCGIRASSVPAAGARDVRSWLKTHPEGTAVSQRKASCVFIQKPSDSLHMRIPANVSVYASMFINTDELSRDVRVAGITYRSIYGDVSTAGTQNGRDCLCDSREFVLVSFFPQTLAVDRRSPGRADLGSYSVCRQGQRRGRDSMACGLRICIRAVVIIIAASAFDGVWY